MYFNIYKNYTYGNNNINLIRKSENNKSFNNYKKLNFNKKMVKFDKFVSVILIPSRKEYEFFGLINELWYTEKDYILFFKNRFNS